MKNFEKKEIKTSKGITLIALVVTIIVLLVLAGISINIAMGSNGLIQRARDSKIENEKGREKEIIAFAYDSALIKKTSNGDTSFVKGIELNSELNNAEATAKNNNPIIVTFIKSNRQYNVFSNGEISYKGIKLAEDEFIQFKYEEVETESRATLLRISVEETDEEENVLSIDKLQEIEENNTTEIKNMFIDAYKNYCSRRGANSSYIETISWESLVEEASQSGITITTINEAFDFLGLTYYDYSDAYDFIIKCTPTFSKEELQNLETTNPDRLHTMFLVACSNNMALNAYYTFNTWEDVQASTVEEAFEKYGLGRIPYGYGFVAYMESADVYEFIINNNGTKGGIITCNGESKSSSKSEFIVTNNGNYEISFIGCSGKEASEIKKVTHCLYKGQEEKFSEIKESNYTLSKDGYDAVIPKGFAYGISDNIGNISKGLVITDKVENGYSVGNEFVWIPVDKDNLTVGKTNKAIATKTNGTNNYKGILYSFNELTSNAIESGSNGNREPAADDTQSYYDKGITVESMQNDYNTMISSIKKYGGFYVARYEIGKNNNEISKLGTNIVSSNTVSSITEGDSWSGLFFLAKNFYNKEGVTSEMIWGSQYDALLNFSLENPDDCNKVTESTNGNHGDNNGPTYSGVFIGNDSISNVFDLEGNYWEYTKEATGSSCSRVFRGGSSYGNSSAAYYTNNPPSGRNTAIAWQRAPYYSTRITLFINE